MKVGLMIIVRIILLIFAGFWWVFWPFRMFNEWRHGDPISSYNTYFKELAEMWKDAPNVESW